MLASTALLYLMRYVLCSRLGLTLSGTRLSVMFGTNQYRCLTMAIYSPILSVGHSKGCHCRLRGIARSSHVRQINSTTPCIPGFPALTNYKMVIIPPPGKDDPSEKLCYTGIVAHYCIRENGWPTSFAKRIQLTLSQSLNVGQPDSINQYVGFRSIVLQTASVFTMLPQ